MEQEFEWDEQKSQFNFMKHGITFEFARLLFFEDYLCQFDDRFNYGEDRWQAMGYVYGIVLFVTYTIVNEKIRLISARKASKKERKIWEEYFYG